MKLFSAALQATDPMAAQSDEGLLYYQNEIDPRDVIVLSRNSNKNDPSDTWYDILGITGGRSEGLVGDLQSLDQVPDQYKPFTPDARTRSLVEAWEAQGS